MGLLGWAPVESSIRLATRCCRGGAALPHCMCLASSGSKDPVRSVGTEKHWDRDMMEQLAGRPSTPPTSGRDCRHPPHASSKTWSGSYLDSTFVSAVLYMCPPPSLDGLDFRSLCSSFHKRDSFSLITGVQGVSVLTKSATADLVTF